MKINHQIISIPPYISTTWDNIASVSVDAENKLILSLLDGNKISIGGLDKKDIDLIFENHLTFMKLEEQASEEESFTNSSSQVERFGASGNYDALSKMLFPFSKSSIDVPFQINPESLGSFVLAMQHNPLQKDNPPLPKEILEKISTVASIFIDDQLNLPKPEKDCRCPYCQILRAMQPADEEVNLDEIVKDEDLKFCNWKVKQEKDDVAYYTVTNPLDADEKYNVSLKQGAIGCTCGQTNCEHLKAVLES